MTEFLLLLPEIFLAITLAFVVVSEIAYHGEKVRLLTFISLGGLAGALAQTLISYTHGPTPVFGTAMVVDGLSLFFKIFFILLAGFSIVASRYSREIRMEQRAEHCALVVGSCLAACVASSAADVLLAFLALQFLNIMSYFLAAFSKKSVRSTEAAVKHLIFGAVAGGLFLFAVAILFASTQSINIYEMHKILIEHPLNRETGLVVFMLMFLSLAFQMSAFPMSLWAPDVIQGSPTPVSSFVTIGSRAAGVAVSLRFLLTLFAQPSVAQPGQWQVLGGVDWTHIVALVSGLTMVFGSLLAFRQTTAKRLVAYLVVADTGFLLLGLLVLDQVGMAALLYQLVVQLFAVMGAYFVLSLIFDELGSDDLVQLKGMLARAVPECVCLILFLACLVGLPPLPGFIGKFALIGAAIRHEWYLLAAIAIASSAISAIGVARLSFSLMGDLRDIAQTASIQSSSSRRAFLAALLVPLLLVGVFAELILQWAGQSLRFILW